MIYLKITTPLQNGQVKTTQFKSAVHANLNDTCRKQERRKEKELSRKSISDSEE